MPGYLKRVSINFYTKCMMLDAGEPYGIHQDRMQVFLPVDGMTAQIVLATLTVLLLGGRHGGVRPFAVPGRGMIIV